MSTTKIALVTGGSRGLGKNMALSLAQNGLDVIITYHTRSDDAESVVAQIKALGRHATALPLDVANASSFGGFIERVQKVLSENFGRNTLDYLVNNAGAGFHAPFTETDSAQLDDMFNIHFKAPYLLSQHAVALLAEGGGIVNLSSGLARFSYPGYSAYASMKSAIDTLTRYQAAELGSRKIRVNAVAPGAIATDFGGGQVRDNADLNRMIAGQTALGRVGQPEDIGSVVAFLCSDAAKWVNGQRIEVSGGIHL